MRLVELVYDSSQTCADCTMLSANHARCAPLPGSGFLSPLLLWPVPSPVVCLHDVTGMSAEERGWHVCVTTYEIAVIEKGPLSRLPWQYLVIDEAHRCVAQCNTDFITC